MYTRSVRREQKGKKFFPTFPDCRFSVFFIFFGTKVIEFFCIEEVNVVSFHGFLSFANPEF